MNLDNTALYPSYRLLTDETIFKSRRVMRYERSGSAAEAAAAVDTLIASNQHLFIVSLVPNNLSLEAFIGARKFLVINGSAVCITDKERASHEANFNVVDWFFSLAVITDIARCSEGHFFERSYIQVWSDNKNGMCPCSENEHLVGDLNQSIYDELKHKTIVKQGEEEAQFRAELDRNLSNIERIARENESALKKLGLITPGVKLIESGSSDAKAYRYILGKHSSKELPFLNENGRHQLLKRLCLSADFSTVESSVRRVPKSWINELQVRYGYNPSADRINREKLRIIFKHLTQTGASHVNLEPSALENLGTAISLLLPKKSPSNQWQAKEMAMTAAYAAMGVYFVASGAVALVGAKKAVIAGGIALAGAGAYHYFDTSLPTEIAPCRNLTELAKSGSAIPLFGREEVIRKILECWKATGDKVRQHPLLVGPAGAGKTAIMEEVARRIAHGLCDELLPSNLIGTTMYSCTAAELLPSNMFQGAETFETFLRRFGDIKERAIVSIDEVHALFNPKNGARFGDLMKSVLDTSIGGLPYGLYATTSEEYAEFIGSQDARARRFNVIHVDILGRDATIAVMHQQISRDHPGLGTAVGICDYIYDATSELGNANTKFRQPEISKQVLGKAIARVKEINGRAPSQHKLTDKILERDRIVASLSNFNIVSTNDEIQVKRYKILTGEIHELESAVSEEKKVIERHGHLVSKIVSAFKALATLAVQESLTDSEEQKYLFLTYILLPIVIAEKQEIEKSLQMQVLTKGVIDAIVDELKASVEAVSGSDKEAGEAQVVQ